MTDSPKKPAPDKLDEGRALEWLDEVGIGFSKKKPVQSERKIPAGPAPQRRDGAA